MKSSWIAGIVFFYIGLLVLSLIAEQNVSMKGSDVNVIQQLITPSGTDFSNPVVATVSLITDVWQYFRLLIQVIFLWFPDLWVGSWLWFYYIVCVPITVMMIATFITILRGSFTT